jgi:peptide/nickel transport system permease protein
MLVLVVRRLLLSIVTLAIVSVVVFTITEILPGDAATAYFGRERTPERLADFRANADLNRPVHERFLSWSGKLLKGDFGMSLSRKKPVTELIIVRFRNTLLLGVTAALISIPLAIILGVIAGLARNRSIDVMLSSIAISVMSIPTFVTAIFLTFIFSVELGLLPAVTTTGADASVKELLPAIILPTVTLMSTMIAPVFGMVRTRMIESMTSDFIQLAKLRGIPYARVIWRYALPNIMLPTIQILSLMTSSILGGLVIIETIFNYPGLGTLTVSAIQDRDIPLVQGIAILLAIICIFINLAADLLMLALDPKVRTLRNHII